MTNSDNNAPGSDPASEVRRLSNELKALTRRRMDIEERTGDPTALTAALEEARRDTSARTSPELAKARHEYDTAVEDLTRALADADWYRWGIHRVLTIGIRSGVLDRANSLRYMRRMHSHLQEEEGIREDLRDATAGYTRVEIPAAARHYTAEELGIDG